VLGKGATASLFLTDLTPHSTMTVTFDIMKVS
jgi:hypothetical protein